MQTEIFRLELPARLRIKIESIDSTIKQQLQTYASELTKKGQEIVSTLIEGYLIDKDTPNSNAVELNGNYLIWYATGNSKESSLNDTPAAANFNTDN